MSAVASIDVDRVRPHAGEVYRVAGVLNAGQGLFEREPIDGAATTYSALHRLHEGQLVMRKLTAWEGPITTVPAAFAGSYVSPEFPTYTLSTELDPRYMRLVCQLPSFWDALRSRSTGTVQRRKRVNPEKLLEIEIDLPPRAEQARIVDLVRAIDDVRDCSTRQSAVSESALRSFLARALGGSAAPRVRLEELVEMGSGPSWSARDETDSCDDGAWPVVSITATPQGRTWIDVAHTRFVRRLPASTRRLTLDSLLLVRTNGNRNRIGNVYRVPQAAVGHAYSAFQIGMFPRDPGMSKWLFWCLASPDIQKGISAAATGSTGLSNIAVRWLNNLRLPWPDEPTRSQVIETAEALELVRDGCETLRRRIEHFRRMVLADMISGNHAIPQSYDRLLGPSGRQG